MAIAPSDVAVAARSGMPAKRMSSGTARMPPPTPKNAEKTPAASPMATRRTGVSYEGGQSSRRRLCWSQLVAALGASPRPAAHAADRHRRSTSCDPTRGSARHRSAAATGWHSRTGPARAARTGKRRPRCYVARAVDETRRALEAAIPRARSFAASNRPAGVRRLRSARSCSSSRRLRAGREAAVTGGYYRVRDIGIRCIRAPCFSYAATQRQSARRARNVSRSTLAAAPSDGRSSRRRRRRSPTNGRSPRARPFARRPTAAALPSLRPLPQTR